MSNEVMRNQRKRNLKSNTSHSSNDISRHPYSRPSSAERMLRARGLRPSVAKLVAVYAGLPVEGDQ